MAERKAKPAAKKAAVTKGPVKAAVKPKTTKAAAAVPKKTAAKKVATAAKPKTTKATAAKKTAPSTAAKKSPAIKAPATKAKSAAKKVAAQLNPEERYRMVQTAAYFIAERHGFGGCAIDHWAAAELEIASKLGQ